MMLKLRNYLLDLCFSKCSVHTKSPEVLVEAESNSVGLGWGLRFCIPDKTPHDTDTDGVQTTLGIVRPWTVQTVIFCWPVIS